MFKPYSAQGGRQNPLRASYHLTGLMTALPMVCKFWFVCYGHIKTSTTKVVFAGARHSLENEVVFIFEVIIIFEVVFGFDVV